MAKATSRSKTHSDEFWRKLEASDPQVGTDAVLDLMRRDGIEPTRENYLNLAYPGGQPEDWGAELEAGLPRFLQQGDAAPSGPPVAAVVAALPKSSEPEHDPQEEGRQEQEAWRRHRERQRRPLELYDPSKVSPENP